MHNLPRGTELKECVCVCVGGIFDFAFKADALPLAACGVLFLWADLFQEVQQNLYIHCPCPEEEPELCRALRSSLLRPQQLASTP